MPIHVMVHAPHKTTPLNTQHFTTLENIVFVAQQNSLCLTNILPRMYVLTYVIHHVLRTSASGYFSISGYFYQCLLPNSYTGFHWIWHILYLLTEFFPVDLWPKLGHKSTGKSEYSEIRHRRLSQLTNVLWILSVLNLNIIMSARWHHANSRIIINKTTNWVNKNYYRRSVTPQPFNRNQTRSRTCSASQPFDLAS